MFRATGSPQLKCLAASPFLWLVEHTAQSTESGVGVRDFGALCSHYQCLFLRPRADPLILVLVSCTESGAATMASRSSMSKHMLIESSCAIERFGTMGTLVSLFPIIVN